MLYRVYDSLTPALFTLPLAGGLSQMDHMNVDRHSFKAHRLLPHGPRPA